MLVPHFPLIALAVAVAACVQGTVGIGFALIVAPVLAFLSPQLLPASLLLLMLPLNLYTMLRERHAFDWKGAGWITLGRTFGTFAGAAVLVALPAHALSLLVGGATIAAALATMFAPAFSPNRRAFVTVGLVTAISETATGIGGPPLALAYQHQQPPVLRSTVAGCFLLGELFSLGVLAAMGRTTSHQLVWAALLVPFLAVGGFLSSLVHRKLNARLLRSFVLLFAVVSGAILIVRA